MTIKINGGTLTFNLKQGSNVICTVALAFPGGGAQLNKGYHLDSFMTQRSTEPTGSLVAGMVLHETSSGSGLEISSPSTVFLVDTTIDQVYTVTAKFSLADPANVLRVEQGEIFIR